MNKNEHLYEVSPEFQKYWESVCNEPHKALMEKMQAWGAWQEARKQIFNESALKIIHSLDVIARDYNVYDYGLPVGDDEQMDKMKDVVKSVLEGTDEPE